MRGVVPNGAAVIEARVRRGLTQDELARLARLDVKTVRKAEQGKRIDLGPLSRLAEALQTEVRLLSAPAESESTLHLRRRDTIARWMAAFDAQDAEAALAAFTEDATLHIPGDPDVPCGGVFRGREEIRKAHELSWSSIRSEPTRIEDMELHYSDSAVTMHGSKGYYKPNGEVVYLACIHIFTFVDDLISDHDLQYDTLEFKRKIVD